LTYANETLPHGSAATSQWQDAFTGRLTADASVNRSDIGSCVIACRDSAAVNPSVEPPCTHADQSQRQRSVLIDPLKSTIVVQFDLIWPINSFQFTDGVGVG